MRRARFGSFCLAFATLTLAACQSSTAATPPPDAASVSVDAGPSAGVLACRRLFVEGLDLGSDADSGHVSFRGDLMPFFGENCTFGGCHDGRETTGQLRLGDPCTYDPRRSICVLDAGSLTENVAATIHSNLLSPSNAAPKLRRVTPGHLDESFILFKLSGCQDAFPERTGCAQCGNHMPPVDPLRKNDPAGFAMIARWIAQGAELD